MMCPENGTLVRLYKDLLENSDAVILQHPYMAPLLNIAKPDVPVIYEAHNVEKKLKGNLLSSHPDYKKIMRFVSEAESRACEISDQIICVSDEDCREFSLEAHRKKLMVVQNGVRMADYRNTGNLDTIKSFFRGRPVAVFIGSAHYPNIEAVNFIISDLSRKLPDIYFVIIGSSCNPFRAKDLPCNVLLCGVVEDEVKTILLGISDVGLNPVFSGGGSNLKISEYFAAGIPVISSHIGVRGYDITDEIHLIKANPEEFSSKLHHVLQNKELRESLVSAGRRYAQENLDWDILAELYNKTINDLFLPSKHLNQIKNKLLVITYRFTDPPLGGAEVYLNEILKRIYSFGFFSIDIITFSITNIENYLHFSAKYKAVGKRKKSAKPKYINTIYKFDTETIPSGVLLENCRYLFSLWQKEDLRHARLFLNRFTDTTLMGGWFFPEWNGISFQRWTGETAEIFCPSNFQSLTITGLSLNNVELKIAFENKVLQTAAIRGNFSLKIDLSTFGSGVLKFKTDARYHSKNDLRKLGICITEISQNDGNRETKVSLENDFATLMRLQDPGEWVSSLIDITMAREEDDDSIFFKVRGPHSKELEKWLSDNIKRYDIVLAQGVPFSTSVIGARHAVKAKIPCVILPHYHMEDKYYHWQDFYSSFRAVDLVISFPDSAGKLFFDRIGAKSLSVPGGGINPDEFADLERCRRSFRKLHPSDDPFILLLGRKTGSKNYERVINAIEKINKKGKMCSLVMIGIDEDAKPVKSRYVQYYGNRPREIVLGALASCACLVNMSESESFGIVIVEAWLCKRPVVANKNCRAFVDLVNHGEDGLLCSSDNELVEAIENILDNPNLADNLAHHGYTKAVEKYPWLNIARTINENLLSLTTDYFEYRVQRIYESILKEGDIAIDVGAHVGRHCIPISKSVFPNGTVHAFEPLAECRKILENQISQHHRELANIIRIYPYALSDFEGESEFVIAKDALPYSGLKKRTYDVLTRLEKIPVTVRKIDNLFLDLPSLKYMKIDAEGGEFHVMKGAVGCIQKFRPLVTFEFGENSTREYSVASEDVAQFWIENRYILYDIHGNRLSHPDSFALSAQTQKVWDYIAVPEEDHFLQRTIMKILKGSVEQQC
jgi:FkbM family methyltransferase